MTAPLRTRTIKETMLANIALLPEASLFQPAIEDADDSGFFPALSTALRHAQRLEIEILPYRLWAGPANGPQGDPLLNVAMLHEYWVGMNRRPH